MVVEKILDPVFGPLLGLPPFWIMLILSFFISLVITLIYKYTTDQKLMKELKDEIQGYQKEMKELRSNPEKMMDVQKKAMSVNMKYMMQSLRATLFTFLPIILIFSWMSGHLAYEPLTPGKEFQMVTTFDDIATGTASIEVPEGLNVVGNSTQLIINKQATFVLEGKEGDYTQDNAAKIVYHDQYQFKDIIISNERHYAPVLDKGKSGNIQSIEIKNDPVKILNLFGWKIGWLGTYIIFSIAFSLGLRKLFKIY